MIVLCIVLSVFLVTAIFSLVDVAACIAARPDVAVSSWYDVVNFDKDLTIKKRTTSRMHRQHCAELNRRLSVTLCTILMKMHR